MSENRAYLPRVLLETLPALRAPLEGTGRGEALVYPFLTGCLVLCAVSGLPDGRYLLTLGDARTAELSSGGGFAFAINYLAGAEPEALFSCRAELKGDGGSAGGVLTVF